MFFPVIEKLFFAQAGIDNQLFSHLKFPVFSGC